MYLCVVCVYMCVFYVCVSVTPIHSLTKLSNPVLKLFFFLRSRHNFLENDDAYITFYIEKCDNFIICVQHCKILKPSPKNGRSVVLVSCPMWSSSNNVGFEM